MASTNTSKKKASSRKAATNASEVERFEAAKAAFAKAIESLHAGRNAQAKKELQAIVDKNPDEIELIDRCRTYIRLCERRMADAPAPPESAEELYYLGVLRANQGAFDESLEHLSGAISLEPGMPRALYARACVRALQGDARAAVNDLGEAIKAEPKLRFQASNDPDFEGIRDDAAFIDLMEPTPKEI